MSESRCVLCGEEVPFLRRGSITIHQTHQLACTKCQNKYDHASGEEREELIQQIFRSPHLENRDVVRKHMEARQKEAQERQAKELEQQALLRQQAEEKERLRLRRKELQNAVLQCCGQTMTKLGVLPIGLSHLMIDAPLTALYDPLLGGVRMTLFRCDCCGQIKFFDPKYLSDPVFADDP